MPELPEVETIARSLRAGGRLDDTGQPNQPILGLTISAAQLYWERTLDQPAEGRLVALARLPGQTVQTVDRRGKFVRITLDQDTLLIHLRMTGDLRVLPSTAPEPAHLRFALDFTNGLRLAFTDARKFGRVWITPRPDEVLTHLGPEPLEAAFDMQTLQARLTERQRQLKPLLLDQAFLAGLGNIYTDEALFRAGLHPLRLSNQLNLTEIDQLWQAIRAVLTEGIQRQGSSIDWAYRGGNFQNDFRVYGRAGEPCPSCGAPIQRILVGQRSTHFCPHCQQ